MDRVRSLRVGCPLQGALGMVAANLTTLQGEDGIPEEEVEVPGSAWGDATGASEC